MVYLAIKELATTAEDVIMVTSSIMKDMQPNSEVIYRPNAIRALCRIIDVRTLRFVTVYAGLTARAAIHGPRCRTLLQGRYRRQEYLNLVCRTRLCVPPVPRGKGCRQAVGQRSARSRDREIVRVALRD